MNITFGKHKDKSTELILLTEPDYVKWVLNKSDASGPLLKIKNEFNRLIEIFDKKNLIKKCNGCGEPATRFSFYNGTIDPMVWCLKCDPYSQGAIEGKLNILNKYKDALQYVEYFCGGSKSYYKGIIKNM